MMTMLIFSIIINNFCAMMSDSNTLLIYSSLVIDEHHMGLIMWSLVLVSKLVTTI
jgi:hypothetical protein